MEYKELTLEEERIGAAIVDAAFKVHSALGPGLLEKIYEICMQHELRKVGLDAKRQVEICVEYDGITFDDALRIDIVVEDLVIVELKAVDVVNPVWRAQTLSYMKLTQTRLGYLINFNVPLIKNGIKRMIL